jgi:hypothetical protein
MSDTAVYDEEAAERHVAALFELPEATVAVR